MVPDKPEREMYVLLDVPERLCETEAGKQG